MIILSVPGPIQPPPETINCIAIDVSRSGAKLLIISDTAVPKGAVAQIRLKCGMLWKTFTFTAVARRIEREAGARASKIGFEIDPEQSASMSSWIKYVEKNHAKK